MRKKEIGSALGILLSWLIIAAIGLALYVYIKYSTNHHDVTMTVNKSERIVDTDGKGAKYLIYADKGVFQNTDSLLNMKFNSADVYNQLQEGHTYACDVIGLRVEFMSMYENIVSCNEVK
jgi:hypothetical protein